jgi:hypothetical protein
MATRPGPQRRPTANPIQLTHLQGTIDQIDQIDETLGSATGINISRLVAERLAHCLRPTDTVTLEMAGHHELTVTVEAAGDLQLLRRRFSEACNEPFEVGGREIWVTINLR